MTHQRRHGAVHFCGKSADVSSIFDTAVNRETVCAIECIVEDLFAIIDDTAEFKILSIQRTSSQSIMHTLVQEGVLSQGFVLAMR